LDNSMMRVVLDTNIVVSALLKSGSVPEAVLSLAVNRVVQLCVSEPILAEYHEVLTRPNKLGISLHRVDTALTRIREASIIVLPATSVRACSDPDDDIFLECAQGACANYVVTGNTTHFPDVWGETKIVTAREFLELIIDTQRGE
jgi:putative PIN family toxin of toxin-antitoxin system